ncbi:MAG: ASCH domain-containing protein [Acidobacteriota bacterium]
MINPSDTLKNFWIEFCDASGISTNTPYQVWYFGNNREMADQLVQLVLSGKKRATASLGYCCEQQPEIAPLPNGISIVTDFDGNPICILQTTEIRTIPFNQVDEAFAADEGEGDLSIQYWRTEHWKYFSHECENLGKEPSEDMLVVCERFKVLYPFGIH